MAPAPSLMGKLAVVLDATEAQVWFALMAGRFENYKPVLGTAVVDTLRSAEKLQFATEGSVFNAQWNALAPSTVRERERLGFGGAHPILIREGTLAKSLTQRNKNAVVRADRFSLLFGTTVPYADYHQQTQGPGKNIIPERQLIPDPMPAPLLDEIRQNVRDYLVEGRIRGNV